LKGADKDLLKASETNDKKTIADNKKKASLQAEELRKQRLAKHVKIPDLFTFDCLDAVAKHSSEDSEWDIGVGDVPILLVNSIAVSTFLAAPMIQKVTCTFAGSYKKQRGFDEEGVLLQPFQAKQGREEVGEFFQKLKKPPVVDITLVSSAFASSAWLYGLRPGNVRVECPASSAGQFRLSALGDVEVVIVKAGQFKAAFEKRDAGTKPTIKACTKALETMTLETFQAYKDAGCTFWKTTQTQGSLLWIPAGVIVAERALSSLLNYGIRKSYDVFR
jgi:hypothetical protein